MMSFIETEVTMKRALSVFLGLAVITALSAPADGQSLTNFANVKSGGEIVEFRGDVSGADAISGAAVVGNFLLIVSDELKNPTVVQVLKKDGATYRVVGRVKLPAGDDEVDLEAVAAEGDMVYVTGSHAWTRKIKDSEIDEPKRKESREQFFRFKLKPDGTADAIEGPHSLTQVIHTHPVLKDFVGVASKENGIDIEGMAVKDGRLYFGFRGPVLRDGWVPVLSINWDDSPDSVDVRYVQLDGRGIRDIAAVEDGFLILAGPVGDGDFSYRVYFWDGANQLRAGENPRTRWLGEFSDIGKGKPEGLAVLKAQGKRYELLLVRDGLPKGGPTRWKLTRP